MDELRKLPTLRLTLLLASLALALTVVPMAATVRPARAPYIYYHDNEAGAFIIERATGHDRRVLAEFEVVDSLEEMHGPGWSASGEWFAWYVDSNPLRASLLPVYVVNRDGGEVRQLLDEEETFVNEMTVRWSPTDDALLVGYTVPQPELSDTPSRSEIRLFDSATGDVIAETTLTGNAIFNDLHWTPDGSAAGFYAVDVTDGRFDYHLLHRDGTLDVTPVRTQDDCASKVVWSPDERYRIEAAVDVNELLVTDTSRDRRARLVFDDRVILGARWNPQMTQVALFTSETCHSLTPTELLLLTLETLHVEVLSVDVIYVRDTPGFAGNDLAVWSPDGTSLAFIDGQTRPFVVTTDPLRVREIPLGGATTWHTLTLWRDSSTLVVGWEIPELTQASIAVLDPEITTLHNLADLTDIHYLKASADGRYLAFGGQYDCQSLCVLDVESGNVYRSFAEFDALPLEWHPTSDWLLHTDAINGFAPVVTSHVSGLSTRARVECSSWTESCFGWLPPLTRP